MPATPPPTRSSTLLLAAVLTVASMAAAGAGCERGARQQADSTPVGNPSSGASSRPVGDAADKGTRSPSGQSSGEVAAENPVAKLAKEGYYSKDEANWNEHSKLLGNPMPKLELTDWYNSEVKPTDMPGKILVVDIWATWCIPCIQEIPHHNEIAKRYADKGVLVIGACGGGGEELMLDVAKKHGIEYPAAKISEESTKAWGVKWWPTYAIVDRKGTVRAIGITPDYIEKIVEALLTEQPAETKTASAE